MYKFIFLLALGSFAACNNSADKDSKRSDAAEKNSAVLGTDSTTRDATMNFIDACVENSKLTLGDVKAFTFCKCIYEQVRKNNPGLDSLAIDALGRDTTQVAKMAANCR